MKNIPQENWSKEKFGKFVSGLSKKWAIEGWLMGRALNIAFEKMAHGEWLPWCREYCAELGKDTILRLRKLPERYPDPSKLEGKRLMDAYLEGGILEKQQRKTVARGHPSPVVNEPPPEPLAPDKRDDEHPSNLQPAKATPPPPPPKANKRGKPAPAPIGEPTTKDHLWQVQELAVLLVKHLAALGPREEVLAAVDELQGFTAAVDELQMGLEHLAALLMPKKKRAG
jgi:hypothetical protein